MPDFPRHAAVLVPLFSLRTPSGWGVGEIPDLARFAGWARAAGFARVQLLPVCEVCAGDTSPYATASAFALEPAYLALDDCEDVAAAGGRAGLPPEDRAALDELVAAPRVAWARVRALKARALRRAFAAFVEKEWRTQSRRAQELARFRAEHAAWAIDHGLFSALHGRHAQPWWEWPAEIAARVPGALAAARVELAGEALYAAFVQWQLDAQWRAARGAARALGVDFMGDLPFQVAGDSADAWARPREFRRDLRAGTPPDAFSADGQDWGLPVYDWDVIGRTAHAWMRARAARAASLFGGFRVDHVIGLYRSYYRRADGGGAGFLPADEAAQLENGEALMRIFVAAGEVAAEDLGTVPDYLRRSLARLGLPGYKVLRWEKDGGEFRDPGAWPVRSVATTGNHDVETLADWYDGLPAEERAALLRLPGLEALRASGDAAGRFSDAARDELLHLIYAAPSAQASIPLQDALGTRERVNVPGTVADTNWTWRMARTVDDLLADRAAIERLREIARATGRA